jgi:hypothetical protein
VTGGGLLLLMLLVSWTSLLLQSGALVHLHLQQRRPTYAAECLVGRGYVRTAACRVLAAAVYSSVALLAVLRVRIPGAGTLGPEALLVFSGVQGIWLVNSALDIQVRRQLRQGEKAGGNARNRTAEKLGGSTMATQAGRPVPASTTAVGVIPFSRIVMFAACVLFVLAAFAAGGHPLGGITAWTWGFAGFAAFALSWSVP